MFCFTPKGKLIALPRKATVIDFAYAVHTDVGNSAVGCKINGKFAPLSSELQNGDEVEVLTSKAQSAPPSAWEALARTGKARAAIRRATRTAMRDQYAGLGRRIVERLFMRAKIQYADDKLKGALPRLARSSIDDVMASVGRGELKASDVARAMYPDYKEERAGRFGAKKGVADQAEIATRCGAQHLRDSDPRHQFRLADQVCAEWRRGAGRPHCRHRLAGRGDHDLPDPVAGVAGNSRKSRSAGSTSAGMSTNRRRSAFRRGSWSTTSTSPAVWRRSPP